MVDEHERSDAILSGRGVADVAGVAGFRWIHRCCRGARSTDLMKRIVNNNTPSMAEEDAEFSTLYFPAPQSKTFHARLLGSSHTKTHMGYNNHHASNINWDRQETKRGSSFSRAIFQSPGSPRAHTKPPKGPRARIPLVPRNRPRRQNRPP